MPTLNTPAIPYHVGFEAEKIESRCAGRGKGKTGRRLEETVNQRDPEAGALFGRGRVAG